MTAAALTLRPFDLGPFHVEPDGVLSPRVPGTRPAFDFRWRGRVFHAELRGQLLWIATHLAGLPFAAERPAGRSAVLAALQAVREALAPGWRLALPPGARVLLEAACELARPPTALQLVTESARFAWQVTPYLDLLEECGAVAP
jgi:hypothetical protein